jgi:hypothetical protein
MVTIEAIESRFIFKEKLENKSFITDSEGQSLGFTRNALGNQIILTKDLEGIEVAIEHCADGTKIFHMEKDSKGLPAMHEFRPDGTEIIYLFDAEKKLEKAVTLKINGDKLTEWYSANGEIISQEQRQNGGIVFKMDAHTGEAFIWLHNDGNIDAHGSEKHVNHLVKVFNKYLDGFEFVVND